MFEYIDSNPIMSRKAYESCGLRVKSEQTVPDQEWYPLRTCDAMTEIWQRGGFINREMFEQIIAEYPDLIPSFSDDDYLWSPEDIDNFLGELFMHGTLNSNGQLMIALGIDHDDFIIPLTTAKRDVARLADPSLTTDKRLQYGIEKCRGIQDPTSPYMFDLHFFDLHISGGEDAESREIRIEPKRALKEIMRPEANSLSETICTQQASAECPFACSDEAQGVVRCLM